MKRWVYVILALFASAWLSWQFIADLQSRSTVTAVNAIWFVVGPAGLMFLLGAVFGGIYLRLQSSDVVMQQQGGAVNFPEPKREPSGRTRMPDVQPVNIVRKERIRQRPPNGGRIYN